MNRRMLFVATGGVIAAQFLTRKLLSRSAVGTLMVSLTIIPKDTNALEYEKLKEQYFDPRESLRLLNDYKRRGLILSEKSFVHGRYRLWTVDFKDVESYRLWVEDTQKIFDVEKMTQLGISSYFWI